MVKILEGKTPSQKILEDLKKETEACSKKPALVIVQVGSKEESNLYIEKKKAFGEKAGFSVKHLKLPESVIQDRLIKEIKKLNKDEKVNGIIVQLPLPAQIDYFDVVESIEPSKDVDGLHSKNFKKILEGKNDGLIPATARGILNLLDFYNIEVSGKKVVVVGRSMLVGKPTALALMNRNATVSICHSQTKNLNEITKTADILVVAIGIPEAINKEFVSPDQAIIDVGINSTSGIKMQEEVSGKRVVGDVNFEEVKETVSAITPVPGGVGPMTVASLFQNVLSAFRAQIDIKND